MGLQQHLRRVRQLQLLGLQAQEKAQSSNSLKGFMSLKVDRSLSMEN